jgi:hypothetical protein
MNGSYSVSVVQLPILGIPGGPVHDILVFTDPSGNFKYEIDGGPANSNGQVATINTDGLGIYMPWSGSQLIGQITNAPYFWQSSLGTGTVVGNFASATDMYNAIAAARTAIDEIQQQNITYGLWTNNSNSVANAILQSMDIPLPSNSVIAINSPGFNDQILTPAQINAAAASGGLSPVTPQQEDYDSTIDNLPDGSELYEATYNDGSFYAATIQLPGGSLVSAVSPGDGKGSFSYSPSAGATSQGNDVYLNPNASLTFSGSNNTISLAGTSGSTLSVLSGGGNTVDSTGNTAVFGANSAATINGAGNTVIMYGPGSDFTASGSDTFQAIYNNGPSTADTTINASNSTIYGNNTFGGAINGSNDAISLQNNDPNMTSILTGGSETIYGTGDTIAFGANTSSTVDQQNDTLILYGNNVDLTATGTGDVFETINKGPDAEDADITASNATFDDNSNFGGTVDGSHDTFNLQSHEADATTIDGDDDKISATDDTIDISNGSSASLTGTGDTVSMSDASLYVEGANSGVTVNGSSDSIYVDASNETIDASNGSQIYLAPGVAEDDIDATDCTFHEGGDNGSWVNGSGDAFDGDSTDSEDYNGTAVIDSVGGGFEAFGENSYFMTDDGLTGGFAGSIGPKMNVIAQYDFGHGYTSAGESADAAWTQAQGAIQAASNSEVAAPSRFNGITWNGDNVTWSFATPSDEGPDPVSGSISSQYQSVIENAFQTWAKATGLHFEEVQNPASADIQIGWGDLDTSASGLIGLTSWSSGSGGQAQSVLIRLEDPSEDPLQASSGGRGPVYWGTDTGLSQVALHEIGHAIGLGESANPSSIMYPLLGRTNAGLSAMDIQNVEALFNLLSGPTRSAASGLTASTTPSSVNGAGLSPSILAQLAAANSRGTLSPG